MNHLFLITGKSASGKDTVYKELLKKFPEAGKIVPYTTRPPRPAEINGVDYHFVDEKTFFSLQQSMTIIESRCYHTANGPWFYATVAESIPLDRRICLSIATIEAYTYIERYFRDNPTVSVIPIYIETDDYTRLMRAMEREHYTGNDNYSELCRRFLADEKDYSEDELKKAGIKYRFLNEKLQQTVNQIFNFIKKTLEEN